MIRYKQSRTRRKTRLTFKIAVVSLFVGLLAFSPAMDIFTMLRVNAASSADASGPNENWLDNKGRYALQDDSQVKGAGTQYIPLYIENTGPKTDPAKFPPSNVKIRASDFAKGYIEGTFSRANFTWCDGSSRKGQTGYTRNTVEFTIPKECFTYQPMYNAWASEIKATLEGDKGTVKFRLDFVSPKNGHQLFGYSTKNGNRGFAVANRYRCDVGGDTKGCGEFYDYKIPFGVPCSVTGRVEVSASIFDGDNSLGGKYNIQYNKLFKASVYDVTAKRTVGFNKVTGSEGDNVQRNYFFYVEPEHRYQFRVKDVYTNNVLQFRLPYNSIEYQNDCSWDLQPSVSVNPTKSEGGASGLSVEYFMPNVGATTSDPVQWQLSRCTVNVGVSSAAYSTVADNTSNGVNTYNNLGADCQQVTARSNQKISRGTPNKLGQLTNQLIPDLAPGSRVCYVLSVNPPTNRASSNTWRHSTPACVLIGKQPKVQIIGNDLFVGRQFAGVTGSQPSNIQTSMTIKTSGSNQVAYGSWSEYGTGATGVVTNFASGAAYAEGNNNFSACQVSLLTFANTQDNSPCSTSTILGNYQTNRSMPDIAGAFVTSSSTPALSGSVNLSGLNGVYRSTGSLTINGSIVRRGQSVIINASGSTVTINGNIIYDDRPISSIEDIPQVIIIADNIRVRGVNPLTAVNRVDAWLIARNTLNTCYDANTMTSLTISRCNTRLTVNGPVMAGKLELWRTAGSGAGSAAGEPAEVFNLRPDAYLWGVYQASSSGRLQSVYERELPPRF